MMVDVHIRDNRTVMRFSSRDALRRVTQRDIDELEDLKAYKIWIDRGRGDGFQRTRLMQLHPASVSFVEQLSGEQRDAFLAEHDPELLAQFREREREAKAERVAARLARVEAPIEEEARVA